MKLNFLSIFYTWMTSFISLKPFNLEQTHLNLRHENNNPINKISEQPIYKYYYNYYKRIDTPPYNYNIYKSIDLNFSHIELTDNITNIYYNNILIAKFHFNPNEMLIFYENQYKYINFINNKNGLPLIFKFYDVYSDHNSLSSTITQKLNLNDEYIGSSSIFNKTKDMWSIYSAYGLNGADTYLYFVDSYISTILIDKLNNN